MGRVIGTAVAKSKTDTPFIPFKWERQTREKAKLKEKELQKIFDLWVVVSLTLRGMTTEPSSVTATPNSPLAPLIEEEVTEAVASTATPSSLPGYLQSLLDSIPLEPTFSHSGTLWFLDFLAPDPLLFLPIMLSLSMFANIKFQTLQYPYDQLGENGQEYSSRVCIGGYSSDDSDSGKYCVALYVSDAGGGDIV
ncbi:hypothetical protein EV426DRAFT_577552 [Tirmania nivea]|nr:hypothetical protein EV426DRAFT_577552 [Tirmania nivea]